MRTITAATKHRLIAQKALPNVYAPTVALMSRLVGLPMPEPEIAFAKATGRRWRLDWAYCAEKVGLDIDGGSWLKGGGRHNRGAGFIKDMERWNALVCLGWRVLRCTPAQLNDLVLWKSLATLVNRR